jgi:mRNA interferase YafQ
MLNPFFTSKFKKDFQRLKAQNKILEKLDEVMMTLEEEKPLAPKHKDHPLHHNWVGRRECHIEPDWLLIYKIEAQIITFERTGSHSEIFD